jgi:hypothetical protein
VTAGLRLLQHSASPLLLECWDSSGVDWQAAQRVMPQVSTGERYLLEFAAALDGLGEVNVQAALAAMDGYLRDAALLELGRMVTGWVR